jgi:tetratricopeptide (TPR) repeat protein
MLRIPGFLNFALIACFMTLVARSQVVPADAEYAAGMSAKEKGDYSEALRHLQQAVALDPAMVKAHFAIGVVADIDCQNRSDQCQLAIDEYKKVLEFEPSREDALVDIAWVLYSLYRLDESESYYRSALALIPNDPEALCGVAALEAKTIWLEIIRAKVESRLTMEQPLIRSSSCHVIRDRNLIRIEEGITLLARGLDVRRTSEELMAYLSWLYRARAEIQCDDPLAYKADEKASLKWNRMRLEIAKRRADRFLIRKCPTAPPPMIGRK